MPSEAWKAFERTVAKFFGTERAALSGGNGKLTRSDSMHENLFVSCKHSSRGWGFEKIYKEEVPKAEAEDKIPVLALKRRGQKGFFIVAHSDEFEGIAIEYLQGKGYYDDDDTGDLDELLEDIAN